MLFEEQLETAIALALKLETLLASEYSSLKVQDISTFQNIQSTKTDLLLQLQLFDQHKKDFVEKHKVMGVPPEIEPLLTGDPQKKLDLFNRNTLSLPSPTSKN
jgi:flagellar biosynthesis/type III secretory pathway chaperone